MRTFFHFFSVFGLLASITLLNGCGGSGKTAGNAPESLVGKEVVITFTNNLVPAESIDRLYLTTLKLMPLSNSSLQALLGYNGNNASATGEVARYLYAKTGDNTATFVLDYTVKAQTSIDTYNVSIRVDSLEFMNSYQASGAAIISPGQDPLGPYTATMNLIMQSAPAS